MKWKIYLVLVLNYGILSIVCAEEKSEICNKIAYEVMAANIISSVCIDRFSGMEKKFEKSKFNSWDVILLC